MTRTRTDIGELERAVAAAGGFVHLARDPRIDRPLDEQVVKLLELATAQRPPDLVRSVPVRWDDYDELITGVVGKLLADLELVIANQPGRRVVDGGQPGTLVTCEECSGSGVLHRLDELPPASTPSPGEEVASS